MGPVSRILDIEKVQGALDDAGALSRNLEAQRGALGSGVELAPIALRLRNEMKIAILNWATVEALNYRFEQLEASLGKCEAWQPVRFAVKALVRDVIVALMRVTDGEGQQRHLESLGRFVALLEGQDQRLKDQATESVWVSDGLKYLRQRVDRVWSEGKKPDVATIWELRTTFRPIRDSLIAHAKDYSQLDVTRDVPKVREFLGAAYLLTDAACVVCNLESENFDELRNASRQEAERFWDIVLAGSDSALTPARATSAPETARNRDRT